MKRPLIHRPKIRRQPWSKSGQALLESFAVMMLLCLILFGVVQYVLMLTATEIVQYSADAAVRARTVGFHQEFVGRVARVAAIANSGNMINPGSPPAGARWNATTAGESFDSTTNAISSSQQVAIELDQMPYYLGANTLGEARTYLDYEYWDNDRNRDGNNINNSIQSPSFFNPSSSTIGVAVEQRYPLKMPLFRLFSDQSYIHIRREAVLADHSELYLQ